MKRLAVLAIAAVLAGCSPTPYKNGFGDSQLSDTTFKINSRVDGFSPRSRADDIAMLRASEIACIKGYEYFDITSEQMELVRKLTYKFITIELKKNQGQYNARMIMKNMKEKLNTSTSCSFI